MVTEKRCKRCGGKVRRTGADAGYSTAQELGRPAGAKGRDEFIVFEACVDCGWTDYEEVPVPCHICGGEPVEEIDLCARNHEVTGMYEWVPGLPTTVNICGNCGKALDAEITRLMKEACEEGGFE